MDRNVANCGFGSPCIRALVLVGTLVTLLHAWTGGAEAGAVPATATSTSLGIDPVFLDAPCLMFRLPQAASGFPSQLIAFASRSSEEEMGIGGAAASGGHRFFLLSQPARTAVWMQGVSSGVSLIQGGWGWSNGTVRMGAAARAAFSRMEYELEDSFNEFMEEDRNSVLEGAIGMGLHRDRIVADLVFEARREDGQSRLGSPHAKVQWEEDEIRPAVAMRSAWMPHDGVELLLVGGWSDVSESWKRSGLPDSVSYELESFGDAWSIGAAFTTENSLADWLAVSVVYADGNVPDYQFGSLDRVRVRRNLDRVASLTLSVRQGIVGSLSGMAGVRKSYIAGEEHSSTFGFPPPGPEPPARMVRTTETTADRFSWGVAYGWRGVRLAGAMDTNLDLDDLFLAVELRIDL